VLATDRKNARFAGIVGLDTAMAVPASEARAPVLLAPTRTGIGLRERCEILEVDPVRLVLQLTSALTFLTLTAVAALGGLAYLKFTSFLADSVRERLDVVLATSAQDFGAALDLGLSLSEVANGSAILERARSHDPTIRSIFVVDPTGLVLHAAGARTGEYLDDEALEALSQARAGATEDRWSIDDGVRIGSGIVLTGSFGQPVGAIFAEYPTTELERAATAMGSRLLAGGGVAAAALIGMIFVVMLRFRPRLRALQGAGVAPAREA